jgi:hypothetical protein
MPTPRETTPRPPTPPDRDDAVVTRIRSEFTEMPSLRLSSIQAQRLFHLPLPECERALEHLVGLGFLTRAGVAYQKRSDR